MTYYEAALRVLTFVGQPLTAREITDQAIEAGLIAPAGKNPYATMSAALCLRVRSDLELLKMEDPGKGTVKRGAVRWMAVSRLRCQ
jgi:HB1, ASXL, restriction endonuclease HTH domain